MAHLWQPEEGGALAYTVLSTGPGGAQNVAGCGPNAWLSLEIRMAQRVHQHQRAALSFRKATGGFCGGKRKRKRRGSLPHSWKNPSDKGLAPSPSKHSPPERVSLIWGMSCGGPCRGLFSVTRPIGDPGCCHSPKTILGEMDHWWV